MNPEPKDSAFLYADDLAVNGKWAEVTVEIAEVVPPGGITYANKRKTTKPTLKFKGKGKGWEIPKTQERLLSMMLGKDQSKWPGQKITLHAASGQTPFGEGPFIRIRPTIRPALIPIGLRNWFGEDLTGQSINQ